MLPASGSLFPIGSTQVTCSAQDDAGNVANTSFTVSVGGLPDTGAPAIAAHADVTAEATSGAGTTVTYSAPTATDAVDGSAAVSCLPASGTLFPLGSTTVKLLGAGFRRQQHEPVVLGDRPRHHPADHRRARRRDRRGDGQRAARP